MFNVSDTKWLRSLVKGSVDATNFLASKHGFSQILLRRGNVGLSIYTDFNCYTFVVQKIEHCKNQTYFKFSSNLDI